MNQVKMLNIVVNIMDNLQSETKEFDFYDNCVRITINDDNPSIVSKDLIFIASAMKECKCNNLDVTMSNLATYYRGRVKFNHMNLWERYRARYKTTIDCMP